MPGPHQIPAGVLAGPQQIPGGLLGLGGHPNPGQLPDPQQPSQPLRVAPVGFDAVHRCGRTTGSRGSGRTGSSPSETTIA
jgi:hypothetical protein